MKSLTRKNKRNNVKGNNKFLFLMVYEPPWQYYVRYKNFLKELKHPFLEKIDFIVDNDLSLEFDFIKNYKAVAFFYHDPLRQLYPNVYRYAKKIEKFCNQQGIVFLNRPDTLSKSSKSIQLNVLKRNGFNVAEAISLGDLHDAIENKQLEYPLFFRYDSGHDSLAEDFTEPFYSSNELLNSDIWTKERWKKRKHFQGMAAIKWIDTKDEDGLYRKYRAFVFGENVMAGPLQVSKHWFVHGNNAISNKRIEQENKNFLVKHFSNKEREIFIEANKALSLDFSAIDFSYDKKGNIIIWEANPHPSLGEWSNEFIFKKIFTDKLSKFYQSKLDL